MSATLPFPPHSTARACSIDAKTVARFWAKVDRRGADECWPWIGARSTGGYGNFWALERYCRAPRIALALSGVDVPAELDVCHSCDNPPCVNPAHLFLGTRRVNMRDMSAKGRCGSTTLDTAKTRGERNVKAKLTEADVRALVAAWNAGDVSKAELARRYGVWPSNVVHILKGRTWAHLGLVIRAGSAA